MNGNRPGDSSPSAQMQQLLERYVEPIMAALRALGASPDTIDQKPEMKGKKKPKRYSESVSDLLKAGLLKPETVLQPLRKNVTQTARVLADGRLDVGGVALRLPLGRGEGRGGHGRRGGLGLLGRTLRGGWLHPARTASRPSPRQQARNEGPPRRRLP